MKSFDFDMGNALRSLTRNVELPLQEITTPSEQFPITDELGQPPFESPTIEEALENWVTNKFEDGTNEAQLMRDSCKIFLQLFDVHRFLLPEMKKSPYAQEEFFAEMWYSRWLKFCSLLAPTSSKYRMKTSLAFGRTWLRMTFPEFCESLKAKQRIVAHSSQIKLMLNINHFLNFLETLRIELYSDNSLIWDLNIQRLGAEETSPRVTRAAISTNSENSSTENIERRRGCNRLNTNEIIGCISCGILLFIILVIVFISFVFEDRFMLNRNKHIT